jgi:hypothetical protein
VTELSLNEVESLAAKAARGAGFPWGLAEDIGRGARRLALSEANWAEALLALLAQWRSFAPPGDASGRPTCPVRAAAFIADMACETGEVSSMRGDVALPVWLDALIAAQTEPRAAATGATINRARISAPDLADLTGYAARTYVPESERSRSRGAGGGRVDDD